ncbi:putative ORFan [Tupanvirus deep ocean]|uniref:ORFan n=2 Tax=Tupanvirus TaxID=2094720 RepID=A0AC62A9M8_9VIRU|nr:putative ORFan [Tupanvirus deep ocean]QKU34383.1 putative ORFan [Tupanvirus deep ocean]
MSRYATYLIDPVVYYITDHKKNNLIETAILSILDDYRIINCNKHKTDWIKYPLDKLIEQIDKTIDDIDKNSISNNYYDNIDFELVYPFWEIMKAKTNNLIVKNTSGRILKRGLTFDSIEKRFNI